MTHVAIKLGEQDYTVPPLNIGQLERCTDLIAAGGNRVGFNVLRIAMERAQPPVSLEVINGIEATPVQIREAVTAVLRASGMQDGGEPGEELPKGT